MKAKGFAIPALLLSGSLAGCTLPMPFANDSGPLAESAVGDDLSAANPEASVQSLDQRLSAAGQPTNQSFTTRMFDSMRGTAGQLADALTPESQTDTAPDPTRLSTPVVPIGADLHLKAGMVYEAKGDLERAKQHYDRAVAVAPRNPNAHAAMARIFDRKQDFASAQAAYRMVVDLEPENAQAWNDLGLCYSKAGQSNESIASLGRAIQISPRNPLYRNNMAAILVDEGRPSDAYSQLVSVFGDAGAHYNVGFLLKQNGKDDEAREHFQLALQANPRFAEAQQMLQSMQQGISERVLPALANPALVIPQFQATHPNELRSSLRPLPPVEQSWNF